MDIEILWEKNGDVHICRVNGRLDLTKSETFERIITQKIQAEPRNLVLNLSRVSYMSSSGIRVLLAVYRLLGSVDKKMCLCEVSPIVKKVIEVVEISQVFNIYPTESEAIVAMKEND